jgi:putative N6-adenine-specific DNA methylase
MALSIPPGQNRRFGFEHLRRFDASAWQRCRDAAMARVEPVRRLDIFGSDWDPQAVAAARQNLAGAGLAIAVTIEQADVLERSAPASAGVLVSNPPYGVRLEDQDALAAWYPQLGDALKQRFAGWHAYLLSADPRLAKLIGLKTSRRTPLFNGALECRLYGYSIVAGSARKPRSEAG